MDGLRPTKPLTGLPPVEALLTPQRWQRIKEIFSLALEHEGGYRAALLEEACAGDEALRAEVDSLLSSAANGGPGTKEVFKSISPEQADFSLPQAEDAMLGRRVGDYRIQRRIGYGGMATVYLAVRADKEYQKEVAVKIVRPDLDNHELFQRFRNERQTLAELDHPNIVKLLDGGTTEEGLPYLVMDYVDGEPITRFCDSHKLSTRQRLTLFCKVCAAVQCAHEHFIVHRDLKPSNILVTVDENPKLLDFGIAKVLNSTFSDETTLTKTLARRLTPAYASPEQVRGQKINIATDIYSLGVVLYELLTGHWPYKLRQHTPAEFERAICEDEPEKPSTAVSRVETETTLDGQTITRTPESVSETREGQPEKLRNRLHGDLDTIVLMALQKEAERRYLSVQKLSEDIQRHLADRPIEARRQGTLYRASKVLRRHKAEVITGAAIFFLMLAASGAFLWQQHRAMEKVRAEVHIQRSTGRRSIAVLGFRNISGRNESSWLSTALAEMLTTELAAGGHLKAVPGENIANVSVPEADSLAKESLAKVYKNLGSDFVVVGSYLELQNPVLHENL